MQCCSVGACVCHVMKRGQSVSGGWNLFVMVTVAAELSDSRQVLPLCLFFRSALFQCVTAIIPENLRFTQICDFIT